MAMSSAKARRTSSSLSQSTGRKRSAPPQSLPAPNGEDSSVAVAVRVRPFLPREVESSRTCVVGMRGQEAWVTSESGNQHRFAFDHSFWSFDDKENTFSDQRVVYEKLARPLLECSFDGYNTCLFAYGQTGSGKSYCMMGEKEDRGVIPRFGEELFERIIQDQSAETTYKVEISFYEIYNERIHDLLASAKGRAKPLRVREHASLGPFVEDLSSYVASSNEDLQGWVSLGNKHRATAATGMNDKSSRSHSVFMIVLTQTKTQDEQELCRTSRINLVDLAGSERTGKSGTTGDRLKEGASINKSLHTLGMVISALCERSTNIKKRVFIPYRDSSLTWLLKESLGGNSKTAMIATVSPAMSNYEESLSTLRYADQARSIVNVARVNEDATSKLIRELREEIERLRLQFKSATLDASSLEEVQRLREQLKMSEKIMSDHTRSFQEQLVEAEARKEEEAAKLKKHGVSFKVDNRLPNLVNLNEDPQLSEMLLYVIKQGRTTVGQENSGGAHDIHLAGALVAENHCVLENDGEAVQILPLNPDAQTYVNGELIGDGVTLHHGDRVVIGGDYFFRFNHPVELAQNPERRSTLAPGRGFEFAQNELFEVQDARLRAEVEEARLKANEEAMEQIAAAKEVAQQELDQNRQVFESELLSVKGQLLAESTDKKEVIERSEHKVEALEAEKRALEAQVIAHRHQLEMDREKLRKVFEEDRQQKTNLIADLENERRKLEDDVVKLKKSKEQRETLNEIMATPEKIATSSGQSKRLMRYYMMLTEANNISESLKKSTSFFIEAVSDGEPTQIRVQNTKLGISTIWPISKFEQKLEKMRELFQGDSEGVDDNDLFYDPKDDWKKSIPTSPLPATPSAISQPRSLSKRSTSSAALGELPSRIPKSLADLLQSAATPSYASRSSVTEASPMLGGSRSFMSSTRGRLDSAFAATASPGGLSAFSLTPMTQAVVSNPIKSVSHLAGSARQHVAAILDALPTEGVSRYSVADGIVSACTSLRKATVDVQVVFQKIASNSVTAATQESLQSSLLRFSSTCRCLADGVLSWRRLEECRRLHDRSRRNPHMLKAMDNVLSSLQRETRSMCSDVTRLLQGVENDIDAVVRDSAAKILHSIGQVVKLAGQASLATAQSPLLVDGGGMSAETESSSMPPGAIMVTDEVSGFDCVAVFLSGASEYLNVTVENVKAAVAEGHQQIAELREHKTSVSVEPYLDGVSSVLTALRGFLGALQQLQNKLLGCNSAGISFSYSRAEQQYSQLSMLYTDVLALPRATSKAFTGTAAPASSSLSSSSSSSSSASSAAAAAAVSATSSPTMEKLVSVVQSLVLHAVDTAATCRPQLETAHGRARRTLSSPTNLSQESDSSDISETTVASSGSHAAAGNESEDPARVQILTDALPSIESAAKDVARAAKSLTNALRQTGPSTTSTRNTAAVPAVNTSVLPTTTGAAAELPLAAERGRVDGGAATTPDSAHTGSPGTGQRPRRQLPSLDNAIRKDRQSSPMPAAAAAALVSSSSPSTPSKQRSSIGSAATSSSPSKQRSSLGSTATDGHGSANLAITSPMASSSPVTARKQRTSLAAENSSSKSSPKNSTRGKQRASLGADSDKPSPRSTPKRRLPKSPSASALDFSSSKPKDPIVEQEV
eukprot:scpid12898/ scgid15267/ Kinesin-like protein KIF14